MPQTWQARYSFEDILGDSDTMQRAVWLGRRAAENGFPTLVVGESGTGKELLAHAIHNASARSTGPFVAINCGTLTGDLAVAEMCGYEPGSFTGADRHTHAGLLDVAGEGTLFLDELQDMPAVPQSVLLRFLETGSFVRVGGTAPVRANVRVIGALNVRLDEVERRNLVRSDLLYRLNCLTIELPPLRERPEDIRPLAEKCLREELHFLGEVDPEVWNTLAACPFPWPGNARGLRNVLLKAILASPDGRITTRQLPPELWCVPAAPGREPAGGGAVASDGPDEEALRAVLHASHDNVSEAARRLGVHRSTIYRRLARNGKAPGRPH